MVTKYKEAARIANSALEAVIAACTAGANLVRSLPRCPHANSSAADDGTPQSDTQLELCKMGDSFVLEAVAGLYKKKKDMKKGVAFPTLSLIHI